MKRVVARARGRAGCRRCRCPAVEFGPVGSVCDVLAEQVLPGRVGARCRRAAFGLSPSVGPYALALLKLLPEYVNGGLPSSNVTSIRPPSLNAGDFSIIGM